MSPGALPFTPDAERLPRWSSSGNAGAGRLVLVGQQTWEPSAMTTVWQVEVPKIERTQ